MKPNNKGNMNEEPKEEKKKTLGEIAARAFHHTEPKNLPTEQWWDNAAEAVQAEVLKEVQREIIADVANRAGLAALHVDQLKETLGPLVRQISATQSECAMISFCAIEDAEQGRELNFKWTAAAQYQGQWSHGYGYSPNGAVLALMATLGDLGSPQERLQAAIADQREKLRNLEEQLAKLDGFAAPAEAEATGGAR